MGDGRVNEGKIEGDCDGGELLMGWGWAGSVCRWLILPGGKAMQTQPERRAADAADAAGPRYRTAARRDRGYESADATRVRGALKAAVVGHQ
jgi:hypothetical protein